MIRIISFIVCVCVYCTSANSLQEGLQYFKTGDFEKARTIFEKLIEENDENAAAYYWLGRTFLQLGNYEEATDQLEEAIDLDQDNADYHFWYGNTLGNYIQTVNMLRQALMASDILDAYETAVKINPGHIGAHIGLAQYYLRAPSIAGGDIENAKGQAKILKDLGSRDGDLINIGILVEEGKYELAEIEYDAFHAAFVDSADNPQFYNGYGYFLIRQKKYDKAILMFKRQVELRPDFANSYDSLGDGFRAAGKLKEALASYKKALQIDPDFGASKNNIKAIKDEMAKK